MRNLESNMAEPGTRVVARMRVTSKYANVVRLPRIKEQSVSISCGTQCPQTKLRDNTEIREIYPA